MNTAIKQQASVIDDKDQLRLPYLGLPQDLKSQGKYNSQHGRRDGERLVDDELTSDVNSPYRMSGKFNKGCTCSPILVVDDNHFNLKVLNMLIREHFRTVP